MGKVMRGVVASAAVAFAMAGIGTASASETAGTSTVQGCSAVAKYDTTVYATPSTQYPLRPLAAGKWITVRHQEKGYWLTGDNDQEAGWVDILALSVRPC
ncbi:hypothetical protein [Amycolatopsis pittospori]|uniref:hypothetical protein n=1 Tax=Amycolatopsis pittospori TaxID=2749434 RepID=UPI0015F00514|nr:hypothetical protein [Amycolatopsis pittospori]